MISLTVNKATPTLDFPEITKIYGDSDFTPNVTTNSSGNKTFSVSDTSIAIPWEARYLLLVLVRQA